MSLREDHRRQLHQLLVNTLTANDNTVPPAVRRSACRAYNISTRQMAREIAAARVDVPAPVTAPGWWDAEATLRHVMTALAGHDTVKQAWAKLDRDGTVAVGYHQFRRHIDKHVPVAARKGITGNGREDYVENSLYCADTVDHRNVRWQADTQEIPVWVRGDRNQPPFKPHQITFIDDATRMVMGTVLVAGSAGSIDVIAALATAMRGHTAPDGTFIGGIPETIRWDNGREFINDAVTTACGQLGISPRPASPYAAWQKGKIERWHQTIQNELFATLPGASDGPKSFTGRQHWRGEDDQLLSLTNLTLHTLEWVRKYNYDRVHSAIADTPLTRWRTDTAPLTYATPAQLHPMMLTLSKQRTVNKDGISYANTKFLHPQLAKYRGEKLDVRVLPHEYDTISVFDGNTFICDAVPAEQLSADQTRTIAINRRRDYREMSTAIVAAAEERRIAAVIAGLADPTPQQPAAPVADGAVIADDDALLRLLGEPF